MSQMVAADLVPSFKNWTLLLKVDSSIITFLYSHYIWFNVNTRRTEMIRDHNVSP